MAKFVRHSAASSWACSRFRCTCKLRLFDCLRSNRTCLRVPWTYAFVEPTFRLRVHCTGDRLLSLWNLFIHFVSPSRRWSVAIEILHRKYHNRPHLAMVDLAWQSSVRSRRRFGRHSPILLQQFFYFSCFARSLLAFSQRPFQQWSTLPYTHCLPLIDWISLVDQFLIQLINFLFLKIVQLISKRVGQFHLFWPKFWQISKNFILQIKQGSVLFLFVQKTHSIWNQFEMYVQ